MSDTKKVDDHEKKDQSELNQFMVDRRKFFKIWGSRRGRSHSGRTVSSRVPDWRFEQSL